MLNQSAESIRAQWCGSIQVVDQGDQRLLIRTPFTEPDGDELTVTASAVGVRWELSDRGHTVAHLGLMDFEFTKARIRRLGRIVENAGLELRDGAEVVLPLDSPPNPVDIADFVQVLAQVRGLPLFEAEQDREQFVHSGRIVIASWFSDDRREVLWPHPRDQEKAFIVDVHVRHSEVFTGMDVFVVGNSEKADRAANIVAQLREWQSGATPLAVVSESVEDRRTLVRLESRFGTENVVRAHANQWEPVRTYMTERGAPMLPLMSTA